MKAFNTSVILFRLYGREWLALTLFIPFYFFRLQFKSWFEADFPSELL